MPTTQKSVIPLNHSVIPTEAGANATASGGTLRSLARSKNYTTTASRYSPNTFRITSEISPTVA